MKKLLLPLFMVVATAAFESASSAQASDVKTLEKGTSVNLSFGTSKVKLGLNLPSGRFEPILDTQNFTPDDVFSYNASTAAYVCARDGTQQLLQIYLLRVDSLKWDAYFSLDGELVNIEEGALGGSGVNKASIEFDANGEFVRQIPYILNTVTIHAPRLKQKIEFDFYSSETTSFDAYFEVKNFAVNGCR
ncbi:flagellar basal body FlgE domain-containing protein [Pseudoalteromonas sp. MMG022]|uniref:flagellar basal body FlgE domain-containing protein n=1 Tax=Pseudoalteromonas sp. MMG022 TaxID=2909978 RepID=UPI001F3D51BD|nr:flagellar basal body FlgE domain-containing protein [Pseudoalteromonas sp. MMG022]MCF6436789.1 hypothetical protein [Pseudoalteromonas sp. MMG022]